MPQTIQKLQNAEVYFATVADVLDSIPKDSPLNKISGNQVPIAIKTPVEKELTHRKFRSDEFWCSIPAYEDVSRTEFLDYRFQYQKGITSKRGLEAFLQGVAEEKFVEDVRNGLLKAPVNIQISPYILSLINWKDPYNDPIRRQYLPVASTRLPNHPYLKLDSLHEQQDSPVPGLVHRYQDKALFLAFRRMSSLLSFLHAKLCYRKRY